jgi:hypothetical protein
MASSSRSLRSQTLNRLLAAYRRISQRLTTAGRWSRTTLVWATQVVIYPLYLVLQSGRRLGQWFPASRLGQTLRRRWRPTPAALPRDAPILACLLSIPGPGQDSLVSPGPLDRSLSRFVHRSGVRATLVPASWMDRVWPTPLQGVACDLASSQLVLVLATNQVVSDLTADQRHQLEQAIWLLLAEYGHHQHRPALAVTASKSLLHSPIHPGRWLGAAITWMQTSPLAIATNLFGEADRLSPSLPMVALGSSPIAPPLGSGAPVQPMPPGPAAPVTSLKQPGLSWPTALPEATALEAEATLLHYIDHPLIILLRLLDSLLHGLETWLRSLWAWLRLRF